MAFVVIPLHRRFLYGSVHPFNLTIRLGVVRLGQALFDAVGLTDQVESHFGECDAVTVPGMLSELDTVARREAALF